MRRRYAHCVRRSTSTQEFLHQRDVLLDHIVVVAAVHPNVDPVAGPDVGEAVLEGLARRSTPGMAVDLPPAPQVSF